MKVKSVMKEPIIVSENISLGEAAKLMSSKGIGSLIVLENSILEGIITDTDLVRNFESKSKIYDVMSKNVITIRPEDNLDTAATRMKKNKIKRLPVVDKDKIVGIITATDLIANSDSLEEDFFFDD
jgi:CBS domain-containing protein